MRRTILNHLVIHGYKYRDEICRLAHGTIRRIDDTHVEVVLVQYATSGGFRKLSAADEYLKRIWRARPEDIKTNENSSEPYYLGLLTHSFNVVLGESDSEVLNAGDFGNNDDVSTVTSMPGDDNRVVFVRVT